MINYEEQSLLEKINKKSKTDLIIVEGKKDKAALEALGIKADFFLLCTKNRSLPESAEYISNKYRKVILMLDNDKKGLDLEKIMVHYLQKFGVKVERNYGKQLLALRNSPTIEGV